MKRFPFLQVAVLMAFVVMLASCGLPLSATDGYYEEAPVRRGVYSADPYYGNRNVIIVERDPYTGRYYQVSPYDTYASPYGVYDSRVYDPRYNNRVNNRVYRNNNTFRNSPRVQPQPQQPQPSRQEAQRQVESSKESILGKKKDQ